MKSTPRPLRRRWPAGVGPIRPLGPGDEALLQEFFRSHTLETIHERYGCLVTSMSAERAHQLVDVDRARDCVLGICSADGRLLHAVGRYCHDAQGDGAELAFVVRETTRRRGLASALLRELIATARTRGIRRLWAQVNLHNADMLGVFRANHFTISTEPDTGLALAVLELAPASGAVVARTQGGFSK